MSDLCPVCASRSPRVFLTRAGVPVHQNLLLDSRDEALRAPVGDLRFAVCHDCGFVFNLAFEPGKLQYGEHYDNTQDCSPYFAAYLDGLAARILREYGLDRHRIVEVGCGKGSFLRRLIEAPGSRNVGFGFDPSYVGPDADLDGRLRFEKRYYGPECVHVLADAVVCRHVIEHVPDPQRMVSSVRRALAQSPGARVFFETPCVEWILRNGVIWDFFYEHCSLFSASALRTLFESAGFSVDAVRHVFGGQYLWLEARLAESQPAVHRDPGQVPALASRFAETEKAQRQAWEKAVSRLAERGKTSVWGAGAKGVTFVNLLDPERRLIDCLIDLNPRKQGRFVPGTGHEVIDFRQIPARGIRSAILMNPIYHGENVRLLAGESINLELVTDKG